MMMAKPSTSPDERASSNQVEAPLKKAPGADTVADLEKRLAQFDALSSNQPTAPPPIQPQSIMLPQQQQPQPAPAAASAAASAAKGKNDLLARIMAAQQRAKEGGTTTAPAAATAPPATTTTTDLPPPPSYEDNQDLLLMEMDNNAHLETKPPAFDVSLLPPPSEQPPPPAFDDSLLPPTPAASSAPPPILQWDPHAPVGAGAAAAAAAPPQQSSPAPSAPALEDLLGDHHNPMEHADTKMPPPMEAPSGPPALDDAAIEAILGIPGLSDEEKRQLIAEQAKILGDIEKNKGQAAARAADAFEQRALANVVVGGGGGGAIGRSRSSDGEEKTVAAVQLGDEQMTVQGQEQTRAAIKNGTAVVAQCMACDNYMQVTPEATMMLCPVCSTVSPVVLAEGGGSVMDAQTKADLELAEKLQKEEYKAANRDAERAAAQRREQQQKEAAAASGQSWMEWLGISSTTTGTPERPTSYNAGPVARGHQGVSRPPGSTNSSPNRPAASTETIQFTSSADEEDRLLSGRARVAEQKPLFACVADSITTALNTTMLSQDEEGNVHGVDSSSLLAVPNVHRGDSNSNSQYDSRLNDR